MRYPPHHHTLPLTLENPVERWGGEGLGGGEQGC